VWRCPSSAAKVLSRWKPIYFLTFEYENERIHLVIILNNWNVDAVFIWAHLSHVRALIVVARGGRGGVAQVCRRRRRHLHTRVVEWRRRSGVTVAIASHLLAVQGRRSGAAHGRSEPLVAVSGLPLCELRMLTNHCWPNGWKNSNIHQMETTEHKLIAIKYIVLFDSEITIKCH
jgi:hypothetical protein